MTIDTNELRRLAQAATPGGWYVTGKLTRYVEALIDGGLIQEVAACGPTKADGGYGPQQEANARLIAAANPAAVSELLDRLESAEKERDDVAQQLVQSEQGKRKISEECDRLRAKIESMERQEPVDLNYIELMNSAQKIVESYVYFRRFIASTPLENDIAVWMADFVFAQLDAKGE